MVTIRVTGGTRAQAAIARIVSRLKDFRPAYRTMARFLEGVLSDQFDSQGARTGRQWAALSQKYSAWKAKKYPGKGLLEREGTLRRSLTSGTSIHAVREIGRKRFVFGTTVPYAPFHQEGGGNLPQRRLIDPTTGDRKEMSEIVRRYLTR